MAAAATASGNVVEPFLNSVRGLATYVVPKLDLQVSGTWRSDPGPELRADYVVTSAIAQPSLGRPLSSGNVTVNLVEPGTLYGARQNNIDLRVAKILRFGRTRTQFGVDVYNLLNTDVVTGYSVALRPQPGVPIVWYGGGRLARDLTLTRLREGWPDNVTSAQHAVDEWRATWRNPMKYTPVHPGRETHALTPEVWHEHTEQIESLSASRQRAAHGEYADADQVEQPGERHRGPVSLTNSPTAERLVSLAASPPALGAHRPARRSPPRSPLGRD